MIARTGKPAEAVSESSTTWGEIAVARAVGFVRFPFQPCGIIYNMNVSTSSEQVKPKSRYFSFFIVEQFPTGDRAHVVAQP